MLNTTTNDEIKTVYGYILKALQDYEDDVPLSELEVKMLDEQKLLHDNHYYADLFAYVVLNKNVQAAKFLISKRIDISFIKSKRNLSLLHEAVMGNSNEITELLIKKQVEVGVKVLGCCLKDIANLH